MQPSRTTRLAPLGKLARVVAGPARADGRRGASEDSVGGGMEIALIVALFTGLGYLLDRWLGTAPILLIVLLVIGVVGVFVRMRYAYEAKMREHEERLAAGRTARAGVDARPTTATAAAPATATAPATAAAPATATAPVTADLDDLADGTGR